MDHSQIIACTGCAATLSLLNLHARIGQVFSEYYLTYFFLP
jgi:hypothetical protein